MSAATSRIMLKVPIRLMLMTRSNSASGIGPSRPTMRLAGPTPAQLIRMRAAPCRPRACASAVAACSASVTSHCTATPPILRGHRAGAVEIDVEAGDLGAGAGKLARGRRAQARGAAGHDGGMSFDVHGQLFRAEAASGFSINSAMPWPPPMQAEAMP